MSDEVEVIEPGEPVTIRMNPELVADLIASTQDSALAVREERAVEVAFTAAQKELIKQIVPHDTTTAELQLFLYQAARTGLDPLARQIYAVKRDGKMVIQTAIDGYRLIADRTGKMAGSDDPVFDEGTDGFPVKATVTVWKIAADGVRYPYTASARWVEYAPADLSNKAAFMWRKMPHGQLAKCAETLALRKACPAELSGVYTDDEMAQADLGSLQSSDNRQQAEPDSGYSCPHCHASVIDNRDAPANAKGNFPPPWKCSNRDCQGGGAKNDGGRWPWGTYDVGFFEPGGDGGDYGAPVEAVIVSKPKPARVSKDEAGKLWDAADPERPFTKGK